MTRPTALIREVLLLQMMCDKLNEALVEARHDLAEQNVHIVSAKYSTQDIWVEYVADKKHDEGIFMKRMLEAELRGYLKRLPNLKKHRGE